MALKSPNPLVQELFDLIRNIPYGSVTSYGKLGEALSSPVSGLLVGRWMNRILPSGMPWWRVAGADGSLPISKRDPALGIIQREHLLSEGISFQGERVNLENCFYEP